MFLFGGGCAAGGVCVRACVQVAGVQCRDRWMVVWAGYGRDMDQGMD